MESVRQKILNALNRYKETGERALEAFTAERFQEFFEILHIREQVFRDLVSLDEAAQSACGFNMAQDEACVNAWLTSSTINSRLEALLADSLNLLAKLLNQTAMNQRRLGAYKSQTNHHRLLRIV